MICSDCGTENRPNRRFCLRCGGALAAMCPACGVVNEPEAGFCGECGARLGTGEGAPGGKPPAEGQAFEVASAGTAPTPVAERRLVTVLFADLVGFTPFAEERDAEEVRETLSRYFELAAGVIGRHGGTVEKFIGDAVMAVWGAPVAREHDAERAVRAALELLDAIGAVGPAIRARAGVVTGEAAVTLGAAGQGMIAGDLVNTASRLQAVAPPGTVLVGEATMRAASGAVVFEPAGEQVLRGKSAPVPAWRALRVVAERGGTNRGDMLEPPFVGRADELRLLKELFHATERERRPRQVLVTGQAGIGKSRLAWELRKYADGLLETIWWHDGGCPAHGDGVTFWALGEMVRARVGLLEGDDAATTRAKVAAAAADHLADADERRWIEPALLALLGVETSAAPEQLFGAWRTFFERLAASAPVVLVFEDLHHADPGLLDFIDHLLEWSRGAAILVLTLARPEVGERRPEWGAGRRSFASFHLDPLPEQAMRELLAGLVPGLPEPAVRSIVERAEGVPLYAVETVRMLLADGRLVDDDGVLRPVDDIGDVAVPETLLELIAARLDALAPAERALLTDGAVLGGSFTVPALAAVSGLDEPTLEPLLRALVHHELLRVEANPRSPERGQHAFVQGLVREVAYGTLARRDRRARHLAAARHLESLDSDELAGALAAHYVAACECSAAGPERDALAAQARVTLRGAAIRAADLGAHDQAVALLEQALAVTTDPAQEAELLELAGDSATIAARYEAGEAFLRRAVAIHRALGDRPAVARSTAALGRTLLEGSHTPAARAVLEPAAAELSDLGTHPDGVALFSQLARMLFIADDFAEAVEVADQVLAVAERHDLVPAVADTLVTKGSALDFLGRPYEGRGVVETGRRLAEANGLDSVALRARNNLCSFLGDDDPRGAMEASRGALELSRRLGERHRLCILLQNLAASALHAGEWDAALAELGAALDEDLEAPDRVSLLAYVYAIRAARREPTDALRAEVDALRAEVDALLGGSTEPVAIAWRGWCDAWEALSSGRLAAARAACLEVIPVFAQGADLAGVIAARAAVWGRDVDGARADLAGLEARGSHRRVPATERQCIRAGILALEGRTDEALATYRGVLRAWRDLGCAWDEALAAIDMATLLGPTEPEVRAAAERGREILVELRARPFLDRLEAAMSGVTPAAGPRPRVRALVGGPSA
jgi:class 3 adenylate cyclase/tetratricopeptide (TPR) repeat protein